MILSDSKGILDLIYPLNVGSTLFIGFTSREAMLQSRHRVTVNSRYAQPHRSKRYSCEQMIGITAVGQDVIYMLRIRRAI